MFSLIDAFALVTSSLSPFCAPVTSSLVTLPTWRLVMKMTSMTSLKPSFDHRRSSFYGRCFPTVEQYAAERHVGVVNICFQETLEDPSLQSFFSRISCSACAVTVISDTIINLFYLLTLPYLTYTAARWPKNHRHVRSWNNLHE